LSVIAIHCAAGDALLQHSQQQARCSCRTNRDGYVGFNALYGHKYVVPAIAPSGLNDLSGNPITGFPGLVESPHRNRSRTTAAMQENGVPITYSYIADRARKPCVPISRLCPGEAAYVAQLKAYDDAFDNFFTRMSNDGINPSNTLFVLTADENDHYAGGPPLSACDGINTPCTYTAGSVGPNTVGEILTNIQSAPRPGRSDIGFREDTFRYSL